MYVNLGLTDNHVCDAQDHLPKIVNGQQYTLSRSMDT